MTGIKITEDMLLRDLFDILPEARELLLRYGYDRICELGIEEVILDKLSVKGLFRLSGFGEEELMLMLHELQNLYNKKMEDT